LSRNILRIENVKLSLRLENQGTIRKINSKFNFYSDNILLFNSLRIFADDAHMELQLGHSDVGRQNLPYLNGKVQAVGLLVNLNLPPRPDTFRHRLLYHRY
jgi:hypothetical protein